MKNSTINGYAYKPYYCPGRIYIERGPLALWEFSPNLAAKKSLTSERRAPGTVLHGKSGPGFCIMFLQRFEEGLG